MKSLVLIQFSFALFFGVVLLLWKGLFLSGSFVLGGIIVACNTWVMAKVFASKDVGQKSIYRSAALRYVGIFLILFFLAVVGVDLLAVCFGMFAVYLAGFAFSAYDAWKNCNKSL